ncbi:hypothetical protein V501_07551 [Pseudogymnoascus sp. VKM F-4519 (FW-2642)]|nr:hypothetical protein V501_07551 [Pseudogymnoascus sp. VKM F-4519 (FW-2642)]
MFRASQEANPDGTAVEFQNYSPTQYNLAVKCTQRLLAQSSSELLTDNLIETFRWIFWLAAFSEPNPIPQWQLDATSRVLQQWANEFDRLVVFLPKDDRNTIVLLRMYHTTMTIMIATGLYGQETLHYEHHGLYEHVVALGKVLFDQQRVVESEDGYIFCFEPGVIFPLFFVAMKCRHPLIRRQAIALLETADHQEGTWESVGAAKVAEFVMDVEEENLPQGAGSEQVLESARVHLVNISSKIERRRVDLRCLLRTSEEDSWYFREGTVFY